MARNIKKTNSHKVVMTDNSMTELEMFSDLIFYKLFIIQKRKQNLKKGKGQEYM